MAFEICANRQPNELEQNWLQACGRAIEAIHSGSLIIDDIEDESEWRRGQPCLHVVHGLSAALNSGNWLYFHAFSILKHSQLPDSLRLQILDALEVSLSDGHVGQAIDISTNILLLPKNEIARVCEASLELKSGALMALAFQLGGLVGQSSTEDIQTAARLGRNFGVLLQKFDDIGNVQVPALNPKHLEDIKNRRPSYFWWSASLYLNENQFAQLVEASNQMPDTTLLQDFLQATQILERIKEKSKLEAEHLLLDFKNSFILPKTTYLKIEQLIQKVANAYT